MFDHTASVIGLLPGEGPEDVEVEDQLAFEVTCLEMADGWVSDDRHLLPDLESIPAGPFLSALLDSLDRSRLNGFDLVHVLQARERLASHVQAEGMADTVEIAYAAPGDAGSEPDRLLEAFEYAADEIRAGLGLTRSTAKYRMSFALDLIERLPRIWELMSQGVLDVFRVRVIANGTAHLTGEEARGIADKVAERAPQMTTGQLAAWIRRLCVESDPDEAKKRTERAREDRRLVIEPTVDGTANLHLFDIDIADARAIGRRVNAYMISHRKNGDERSHDNLRADIGVDFLLGFDPANSGKGLLDMRVSMTTLAGLDEKAAEIPGLGPVIADVARKFADLFPRAEWRATITDDFGNIAGVVTTARRPTKAISRMVNAIQPTCSFPGCRVPAEDCDFDHLLPHSMGGETSICNGGPKCRHDHTLKDHGWTHQFVNGQNIWTSPLGHIYICRGQSP